MRVKLKRDLLSSEHLGEGDFRIAEEDFMNDRLCSKLAESLYTIHDTLVGVFIDLNGDKLRLANTND